MNNILSLHKLGPFNLPGLDYLKLLNKERTARTTKTINGRPININAKTLLLYRRNLSLGLSPAHYKFFCYHQFQNIYSKQWNVSYEGIENIPISGRNIFVMKHRAFSDITFHGFAFAWATSKLHLNSSVEEIKFSKTKLKDILDIGSPCRFIMKEDLLNLPIGFHLVINGGIPISQDLETKAKNTPGFNPDDPKVLAQRDNMAKRFSFKDSYKEVMNEIKEDGSIMIYGEATRVEGDTMGHLSEKFLQRLVRIPESKIIPVGSSVSGKNMKISYGQPTDIDSLRDKIAELSHIPKSNYIS